MKTKFDSTSSTESEEPCDKAGLSSAMHDMRVLALRYSEDRASRQSEAVVAPLAGSTVDPRVFLMPVVKPKTDRTRIAMLAMMILVGLSTSAIAVRMAFRSQLPAAAVKPVVESTLQRTLSEPMGPALDEASPVPQTDVQSLYQVASSPARESVMPPQREAILPPKPKRASKWGRKSLREGRIGSGVAQAISTCDEVACLLDGGDDCCDGQPKREQSMDDDSLSGRPYRLTRSQVMKPMKSVSGRVATCAANADYQGIAVVKIRISPEGRVQGFDLDEGGAAFQSCVERQVTSLRFPLLRQPFTVSYPFTLR